MKYRQHKDQQHLHHLLSDDRYLRDFIARKMRSENPHLAAHQLKICPRYLAVKESDGKYDWLKLAISKDQNPAELSLLTREIYAGVFQHLLLGYVQTIKSNTIVEFYREVHQLGRQQYRDYCFRTLKIMQELFDFDLLILPKIHDDWIIDFILAAQLLHIPVFCNERESVNTPKRLEVAPYFFKKYVGIKVDRLLLANEGHRDFWMAAGYSSEQIRLIGDIKSDYWHRPDQWLSLKSIHPELSPERFKILVFSFGKNTYRNYYYGDDPRDWTDLNRDFHDVLLQIISKYSDRVQIVYKTGAKEARDLFADYDRFIAKVNDCGGNKVFLRLNQHYSTLDLINRCDAVVGFQTTGMIEAMFTDKPITTVGWGELWDETKDTLLPLHQTKALQFAKSSKDFFNILNDWLSLSDQSNERQAVLHPGVQAARKIFREKYFYQPDGNVSQRLLHEAADFLQKHK